MLILIVIYLNGTANSLTETISILFGHLLRAPNTAELKQWVLFHGDVSGSRLSGFVCKKCQLFQPSVLPSCFNAVFCQTNPSVSKPVPVPFSFKSKGKDRNTGCCPAPLFRVVVPPHCPRRVVPGVLSQGGCPRGVVPERLFEPLLLEMISWLNQNI